VITSFQHGVEAGVNYSLTLDQVAEYVAARF
jgi:hypothetical protein